MVPSEACSQASLGKGSATRLLLGFWTLFVAIGAVHPVSAADSADTACTSQPSISSSGHIGIWLGGFPALASASDPFYFAAEDDGVGRFQIDAGADVCNETVAVRYGTRDGTAFAPSDYDAVEGKARIVVWHLGSRWIVEVPLVADGVVEAAAESFRVALSAPDNGSLREPSSAPFFVVDVDGPARASLGETSATVSETARTISLVVFRAGAADAGLTVPFTVEPSGAAPATAGDDFVVESGSPLTFGAGERAAVIEISIVQDDLTEPDETLRVTLEEDAPDTTRSATVTLLSGQDSRPPRSRFHHPRQGWTYAADDYRIRELHVFTGDGEGSGVIEVELALRRTAKSGACAWWNGERFVAASCTEKTWLPTGEYEPGAFYFYRLERLEPSAGSMIKNYTAFARARDASGNIEGEFENGENRNTFEIGRG